ncbi:MAG TPA: cation-translocating P-type ATPase [Acholeplasmataceae bacterium]|nr:cation-translocating P-type ATPase [Acholeplasmataceae bacterium]
MFVNLSTEEVLKRLESNSSSGLSEEKVKSRQSKYGLNTLDEKKRQSLLIKFLLQFKDILIIILLIAAIVSIIVDPNEWIESLIILFVVLINAFLGVAQESKAEKSLEALQMLSSPMAKVLRDGKVNTVESKDLVPGDIIFIEAGDFVPADARIIESFKLQVDESALTGESLPVDKISEIITEKNIPLGDQKNMLFSSTIVTYGRGTAVVTNTGMNTEIGKIASMLSETKKQLTPLQVKLNQIGKVIGLIAIIICVVIFLLEWLIGQDSLDAFKTSVALAVAAIPEGLSTVVTVVLAIGVEKMAKQKAIVKKLPAVETLGSTSIVCSDKTGTLTQNKMTVVKIYKEELKNIDSNLNEQEKEMLALFALCTDAEISEVEGEKKRIGDPTETALIEANNLYGLVEENIKNKYQRVGELSFDSDRKMMTVIVKYNNELLSITKGAPDIIISKSKNVDREKILDINLQMASEALRVLAVGIKKLTEMPKEITSDILENDLEFVGLVGMIDPPREEVLEAIRIAKKAGLRTIMITGDHIVTAKAIATKLNILGENELAITSEDLNKLSDEELFENIEKYSVYARVAPEDKVRIVDAWQKKNKVVAMTGDGVNDSPALKKADIGCAMGITGTDVAKEAASMILVDDNFATIISAVKQGRGIYLNIKKTVRYLLSSNIGEVVTIFLASIISGIFLLLGLNIQFGTPLLAMHLLWVNLITDTLPAFALGMEEPSDEVMEIPPRDKNESFFANKLGFKIAIQGVMIGLLTLLAYIIGYSFDSSESSKVGHTMAFFTLSSIQLFHAFNVKTEHSVFKNETFNNKFLNIAFILGLGLQLMIMYVPAFASAFKLTQLTPIQLIISLAISFSVVVIIEISKLVKRRKRLN